MNKCKSSKKVINVKVKTVVNSRGGERGYSDWEGHDEGIWGYW